MTSIPSHTIWSCLNNRRPIISSLGSSLSWNQHFLSDNPRHTTFAKRKYHFTDTDSDTQLIDLLQEIRKEVSLKHTRIKQEPYSAPIHGTHINQLQHDITQLQRDIQSLKEAINTPHTIPVTFQQQLSKMKEDTLRELILAGTYFRGFHFFEISRKKWELIFADFRHFTLNENFAGTYFRGWREIGNFADLSLFVQKMAIKWRSK